MTTPPQNNRKQQKITNKPLSGKKNGVAKYVSSKMSRQHEDTVSQKKFKATISSIIINTNVNINNTENLQKKCKI